jgi:hypothetical protein
VALLVLTPRRNRHNSRDQPAPAGRVFGGNARISMPSLTFNVYPEIRRQNPVFAVKLTPQLVKTLVGETDRPACAGSIMV